MIKKINSIKYEELSESYRWDNSRNTFPSRWWTQIILEFLQKENSITDLQEKYKKYLPKSKQNKKDNNMHIYVLLNKLLISKEQDHSSFNKIQTGKMINAINEYIHDVINKTKKKLVNDKIPKNWLAQIDGWNENYKTNGEHALSGFSESEIKSFIVSTTKQKNIQKINNLRIFFENVSVGAVDNNQSGSPDFEKIGKTGEEIAIKMLTDKYGENNVVWLSKINKFYPCDIKAKIDGEWEYFEVKSTTRFDKIKWFISNNELNFQRKYSGKYNFIFIRDVYPKNKEGAIVEIFEKPKIIISNEKIGQDKDALLITPVKYRGLF